MKIIYKVMKIISKVFTIHWVLGSDVKCHVLSIIKCIFFGYLKTGYLKYAFASFKTTNVILKVL